MEGGDALIIEYTTIFVNVSIILLSSLASQVTGRFEEKPSQKESDSVGCEP
jgi:hypothetical protein